MKTVAPGIRQKENGKFHATKSIAGKRYYAEFDRKADALKWRREFHPAITPKKVILRNIPASTDQSNGKDKSILFGEVIEKYKKEFLPSLDSDTQYRKLRRLAKFAPNIVGVPMCCMNPEIITDHLNKMKDLASDRRCNFEKELKDIASIFNWYHDNKDFTFVNPITRVHKKIGKIKEVEKKKRSMTIEQLALFLEHLEEPFQTLALIQTFMAGRIQEAAAINDETVDLKEKTISVSEKIVWMKGAPVHRIGTKTGEEGIVPFNEDIKERLLKLKAKRPKSCKFFFQKKGKPLRYNLIREHYNKALQDAGLSEFSGTHILRHTMATISRREHGIDACQAILRHKSSRMSELYAQLDVKDKVANVVSFAERALKKAQARASECVQDDVSGDF